MNISTNFCVCIPARNEAERLPFLIDALAKQFGAGLIKLIIGLNNTTDDSARVIAERAELYSQDLDVRIDDHAFKADLAHAGSARKRVMDLGCEWIGGHKDGVLLTTDADARPPHNWIEQNLRAITGGADIVGGYLVLDDREPLPEAVRLHSTLWHDYWRMVRSIEDEIDPRPWDPPPRHGDHTGASLAVTASAYKAAGGVPVMPSGEDRALVAAVVANGGQLVHPMAVWTRVSPRQIGRATGGMADVMTELHKSVAEGRTVMAPALDHWRSRAEWRRTMRLTGIDDGRIAQAESTLPPLPSDTPLFMVIAQ